MPRWCGEDEINDFVLHAHILRSSQTRVFAKTGTVLHTRSTYHYTCEIRDDGCTELCPTFYADGNRKNADTYLKLAGTEKLHHSAESYPLALLPLAVGKLPPVIANQPSGRRYGQSAISVWPFGRVKRLNDFPRPTTRPKVENRSGALAERLKKRPTGRSLLIQHLV